MLRPVVEGDVAVLGRQWNEWAVNRYLWDGRPVPNKVVLAVVRDSCRDFDRHGYGLWAVEREWRLIGVCGLRPSTHLPGLEVLVALERAAWGRGHASAALAAVVERARRDPAVGRVVAAANPENVASWRALERAGLRRVGRARTDVEDLLLYST